jgi:polygalacturonase
MQIKIAVTAFFLAFGLQYLSASLPIFDVRDFGAAGSRVDDASPAVAKAIAACHKSGGGTVYFPAGEYRCLPIILYDNFRLEIAAGATVFVDLQNPNFNGHGFICAANAKNICITGMGTIDGQAKYAWEAYRNDDNEIAKEVAIARQAGMEMKRSYRVGKAAYTLYLYKCENVRIEGITISNSSSWCMRLKSSNRVTVEGVTIRSDLKLGVNSDGVDIDGSSNVHVHGCDISTGDDAICLKTAAGEHEFTGPAEPDPEEASPAENILVDDCVLTSSSTAMMIGTETCADIRHVNFNNCFIRNANKGFGINVQDGGAVSDVRFADITMDLQRRHWNWWGDAEAFCFVLKKRLPESKIGSISDVTINNVTAEAQGTSKIISTVGKPLQNISINNFQLNMEPESTRDKRTSNAITVDGVTGLKLREVSVHWDDRAPESGWKSGLSLANVDHFELDDVTIRQGIPGSEIPAILLTNAADGIIRGGQALPGTGRFFEVAGANTRHLLFLNNISDQARSFLKLDDSVNPKEVRNEITNSPPADGW